MPFLASFPGYASHHPLLSLNRQAATGLQLHQNDYPHCQNCASLSPKQYATLEKVMYGVKVYEASFDYATADPAEELSSLVDVGYSPLQGSTLEYLFGPGEGARGTR